MILTCTYKKIWPTINSPIALPLDSKPLPPPHLAETFRYLNISNYTIITCISYPVIIIIILEILVQFACVSLYTYNHIRISKRLTVFIYFQWQSLVHFCTHTWNHVWLPSWSWGVSIGRHHKPHLSSQTMKWQPSTSGLSCSAANDTTVTSSRHYTTVLPVVLKMQQNVKSKLYRHIQYTSRHKSQTQPHISAFGYNPLAPA